MTDTLVPLLNQPLGGLIVPPGVATVVKKYCVLKNAVSVLDEEDDAVIVCDRALLSDHCRKPY
jgi:hypothetical protein